MTEFPLTVRPENGVVSDHDCEASTNGLTTDLLQPEPLLSIRDILVVDVTREQRGIHSAQVERASRLQFLDVLHVKKTRQLERHQGLIQRSIAARECFPERGSPGRCDRLEAEPHEPGHRRGEHASFLCDDT